MPDRPVLKSIARLIKDHHDKCHPGLWLDKFAISDDMKNQKVELDQVVALVKNAEIPDRSALLTAIGAENPLPARTSGALTLHLARASALENAGLPLHRTHGFAYIPAEGIKGLAHAWAMEGWLAAEAAKGDKEKDEAWKTICQVFGWAPSPWLKDLCKKYNLKKREGACSGSVCFLDAWPKRPNPPQLRVDIANNHHRDYYKGEGAAPGDWESPEPIYFLTVASGSEFVFPIAPRRTYSEQDKTDVQFAYDRLGSALAHFGAGAKTNAGYGRFNLSFPPAEIDPVHEEVFDLKIITPAFLGDANKNASPELRIPSLRGILRSWWRAFNGHLSTNDLREKESAIFGSTDTGQGISLNRDPKQHFNVKPGNSLKFCGASGASYMGYGPIQFFKNDPGDEKCHAVIDWLKENQPFQIRIGQKDSSLTNEAKKALWLLCALGGIGSRSRRGWGSLSLSTSVPDLPNLSNAENVDSYKEALFEGLSVLCPKNFRKCPQNLEWTAIGAGTKFVFSNDSNTWKYFDTWQEAMEDIGLKFIAFRSKYGNKFRGKTPGPDYYLTKNVLIKSPTKTATQSPNRIAFGLPHNQSFTSLGRRMASYYPVDQKGKEARRASPLFVKIVQLANNGKFFWQVAFLPSRFLPADYELGVYEMRQPPLPPLPLHSSALPKPDALGAIRVVSAIEQFLDYLSGNPLPTFPIPASAPTRYRRRRLRLM